MKKNVVTALLITVAVLSGVFLPACSDGEDLEGQPFIGIWQAVIQDDNVRIIRECEIREDGYFYKADKYSLVPGSDFDITELFDTLGFPYQDGATEYFDSFEGKFKYEDEIIKVTIDKNSIPAEAREAAGGQVIINSYTFTSSNDTLFLSLYGTSQSVQYERASQLLTK